MASRIGWIVAALVAGLLLLVVGARQVMRRSDTPLVTAQVNPPLVPVRPDGGAGTAAPPPEDAAGPGPDAGAAPATPGEADAGSLPAADAAASRADGGVGAETPAEAVARELEERLQLESRLAELEEAVDTLAADRDLLLDSLADAEERLAALEAVQEEEADRLAEQTPRFDRVAVLEGALADLRQALGVLSDGSGDVTGLLGRAGARVDRVAGEAARLGQDLEADRLDGALGRISAAETALSRNDLFEARVAAAQALTLVAGARDLARTRTAAP